MSWSQQLLHYQNEIRLTAFFAILAIMGGWEQIAPRRALMLSKVVRWSNNLGIVFLNSLLLRLLLPTTAVALATLCSEQGWGLLNQMQMPLLVASLVTIVAMDMVVYLQHVMMHAIPLLWRLHRVHHADLDYDVTTGARFHPIEILLSMLIKFATIILLGPPAVAVLLFEVILNATAMFNHANIGLPLALDRWLRRLLVTPDMHRVHHSTEDDEANSNFGFSLPWWDYIFGTYRSEPRLGQQGMQIGIHRYRDPQQVNQLPGMLWLPFIGRVSEYAINRRQWQRDESKQPPPSEE
ncbi:MAG: sterol desaturase family protein [Candidatus Polarisedimenticolaceae bacterium]|nr:sterol desaturase family protein [Candidatus Polarisedimenticolaceae bacterium]